MPSPPGRILKEILCEVDPALREAFSRAQEAWNALSGVEGFLGQIGGWLEEEPNRACILALWSDEPSYRAFLGGVHDAIVSRSSQAATYLRCTVTLHREAEGSFPRAAAEAAGAAGEPAGPAPRFQAPSGAWVRREPAWTVAARPGRS